MAFYLEKAIFVNRAPFRRLELDFKTSGINVLSATNGKGKTTILSHIADAFYEMAKRCYHLTFKDKENQFYRISSTSFNVDKSSYSLVFFRFNFSGDIVDYIDFIGETFTEEQYNYDVGGLECLIPWQKLKRYLEESKCVKIFSSSLEKKKIDELRIVC